MKPAKLNPEIELPPAQDVAVIEQKNADIISASESLIAIIGRAASDPNCDVDKMERLLAMHEKMESRVHEEMFNTAMRGAQEKMRRVAADKDNSQTHSRYASYAALDRVLRPIYTDAGFSISYDTEDGAPADCVRVVAFVSNGRYTRKYHVDMPADGKGAKGADVMTKTHAAGSAMTYGRRYLLMLIFNIAIGQDDDGNAAGQVDLITETQVKKIEDLIAKSGADLKRFCVYMKTERIEEIPAIKFDLAVSALTNKQQKTNGKK